MKNETECHSMERLVRDSFVNRMESELQDNQRKGDWREWHPTPLEVTQELNYHFAKLVFAMAEGTADRVSEFAADVANIAMKAEEVLGESSGWWNCQCHGQTVRKCTCGAATAFIPNIESSYGREKGDAK